MKNIKQSLDLSQEKINSIKSLLSIDNLSIRLSEIDDLINSKPNLWDDQKFAKNLLKERQKIDEILNKIKDFSDKINLYYEFYDSFPDDNTLFLNVEDLEKDISSFEFKQLFNEQNDDVPAILSIHAGAGGLEAANWVSMLLRMYVRFASQNNFKVEILDLKESEEHSSICIDSVSIRIEGEFAYGFFKSEAGVHRLIRNSPFSSADARHTSCAAVSVLPDIEDTIEVAINEKDLEITAQTSGGPGGQNQNKVASAVRLKHFPSNISIFVRSERDFHANKRTALKMLKAKLYDLELKNKQAEKDKYLSSLANISFGSQIRTYTMTPYSLVKDHRTSLENKNVEDVLDGNLSNFIIEFIKFSKK